MRILLIRHAESENNTKQNLPKDEYHLIRDSDPEITQKGRFQAERLGFYLQKRKLKVKKIYCSTLVRAIQTADILHKVLKADLEIKVPIHGIGGIYFGEEIGTGKGRIWLNEQYPSIAVPPEITNEGWWFKKAKETRCGALERARAFAEEMKTWAIEGSREHDECVAFVSHGRFLDLLLSVLLDRKDDSKVKISHSNTGVTAFQYNKDGSHKLLYVNGADHLDEDLMAMLGAPNMEDVRSTEVKEDTERESVQKVVEEGSCTSTSERQTCDVDSEEEGEDDKTEL
jgi:2,3-bisphosphoglycerate-dependent phosphoglycerate mutase